MTRARFEDGRDRMDLESGASKASGAGRLHRSRGTTSSLTSGLALFSILCLALTSFVPSAAMACPNSDAAAEVVEATQPPPAIEMIAAIDMRDEGYNSEYIFGMTKGLAASTMVPALKPVFFIFTIPLDLALLPFTAIGGFF
jgi:hypothetical protein